MTLPVAAPDISDTFEQMCDLGCGRNAAFTARGCMDKAAVNMCEQCLERGLDVVRKAVRMYRQYNKAVTICGDCHRPILHLDTHLEVKPL